MKTLTCSCSESALFEAYELAEGLPAQRCAACASVLLSLDDYRCWRERQPAVSEPAGPLPPSEEPARARICPACGRIMSRHRTGTAPDFRLDRCGACQLVWLDDGEWALLEQNGLALQLDQVLTDAWQQRVQALENQQRRDGQLRARLGEETFAEVRRIKTWLATHPFKNEIIGLINGQSDNT